MTTKSSEVFTALDSWYSGRNGEYLLATVRRQIAHSLDTAFGYHILQLGVTQAHPLFEDSNIHHRIYASERGGQGVGLIANGDELPLESDSIDVLIAHHSLEFEDNPHQALREMQRVLAPQGHLIIVGFNPYSVFGGSVYLRGLSGKSPWRHHNPVNTHRAKDWLHLLGCAVHECTYLYALPPLGAGRLRQWMIRCDNWLQGHNIPAGGLYVMHAVKQVPRLNRPRRRLLPSRERLIGLAVPTSNVAPAPTPIIHAARNGERKT